MIFSFSGGLITQIQNIRQKKIIEKNTNFEVLNFTINQWNEFNDTEEIKHNNKFYDVVSFKKINSNVIVTAIHDDLENEVRVFISKIYKKSKKSIPEKVVSKVFSKHILLKNNSFVSEKSLIFYNSPQKFLLQPKDKTSDFNDFVEKPPCVINFI